MIWTTEAPTEVGWYWIDCPVLFGSRPLIVEVFVRPAHAYLCVMDPDCCAHTKRNFIPVGGLGRWAGPIPAPKVGDPQ